MRKYFMSLGVLILIMMITQPGAALDKYFIYVSYEGAKTNNIADATVKIWDGDTLVDSGDTDKYGKYTTWLNKNKRYRITAQKNSKFKEWRDFPPRDTDRIDIKILVK